jgi:hypothetical protein
MRPLEEAWREWMTGHEVAELTRHDYEQAWKRLGASLGAKLTDLPDLLLAERKASQRVRARSFNKDRSMWLAFLNETLGDTHFLHATTKRVSALKIPKERKMPYNPQTVEQVRGLAGGCRRTTRRRCGGSASPGCGPRRCSRSGGTPGAWRPSWCG